MAGRVGAISESIGVDRSDNFDLGFLPQALNAQCKSLIESYHDVHGYGSLPDILWKAGLGPFIQRQRDLRGCLKRASTTRSAKKAHGGFVEIATAILSLEILASSFAGWRAIYPEAAERASAVLKRAGRGQHMPLMEFYLYPPKYISSAAIATLAPPSNRPEAANKAELSAEKRALAYAVAIQRAEDGRSSQRIESPV
jgi:hypothetical protein